MLDEWLNLRELSLTQLREQFDIDDSHLTAGVGYGLTSDLVRVEKSESLPGEIYFRDEQFVIMRINHPEIDAPMLKKQIGFVLATSLRSRVGKQYNHNVYAEKGIAFSADIRTGEIRYIEVFPPMSIDDYVSKFYDEPPKFTH